MTDDLEPKCEENLYRKQYGNLKECVLAGKTIMKVFNLDGTCFRLNKPKLVEPVFKAGNMDQEGWDKYCEGRKSYLTKQLTMCKQNKMNYCKVCEMRYYIAAGKDC